VSATQVSTPMKRLLGGMCKVPLAYFTNLLEILNPAERSCFGLVLNRTIGEEAVHKTQPWARIKPEEFAEVANAVDRAYVMERVQSLIAAGWIQERYQGGDPRKPEYSISPQLAAATRGDKIRGRCKECQNVGIFSTEFIAMPRTFFTKLAPGLDNTTFLVVAIVSRYSHERAWTGAEGLRPKQVELNLNDFERDSGLDKRQISTGIHQAIERGLIEVIERKGKPSLYRTCPENWAEVGPRPLRLVKPPLERSVNKPEAKNAKPLQKPTETSEIQSVHFAYGYCPKCCHIVEVEPVSEEEFSRYTTPIASDISRKPSERARNGPIEQPRSTFPEFRHHAWKKEA
jgi:hypothetical protein